MSMTLAKLQDISDNIAVNVLEITVAKAVVLSNIDACKTRIDEIGDSATTFYEDTLGNGIKAALLESNNFEYLVYQSLLKAIATTLKTYENKTLREYVKGEARADTRFASQFQDFCISQGFSLSPTNVFPPGNIAMGSYEMETAVLTPVTAPINLAKYGGAKVKAVITTQIENESNGTVVLNIIGTDENGLPWAGALTLPDATPTGTEIQVIPDSAHTYCAKVTSITVTSGTPNTGAFTLKSDVDRAVAA